MDVGSDATFLLEKNLSGKTVKNIHGVLHRALEQAYVIGEFKVNPSDRCLLPKVFRLKIEPVEAEEVSSFLTAIKGALRRRDSMISDTLMQLLRWKAGTICRTHIF